MYRSRSIWTKIILHENFCDENFPDEIKANYGSGMQLCTTWVQGKVMDGNGQICYSCVSKGCTTEARRSCVLLWSL